MFNASRAYESRHLTWLLHEKPVRLLGRIRADRVMYAPAGKRRGTNPGRPPRHGAEFRLSDPTTHPAPVQESTGVHDRFGEVLARCWGRMHPKLDRRGSWAGHQGELPLVEATLVHLAVEHLPGNRDPKPLWLWLVVIGPAATPRPSRGRRRGPAPCPPRLRARPVPAVPVSPPAIPVVLLA